MESTIYLSHYYFPCHNTDDLFHVSEFIYAYLIMKECFYWFLAFMWSSTIRFKTLSFFFLNYPNAKYAIVLIDLYVFSNWKKIKK